MALKDVTIFVTIRWGNEREGHWKFKIIERRKA